MEIMSRDASIQLHILSRFGASFCQVIYRGQIIMAAYRICSFLSLSWYSYYHIL